MTRPATPTLLSLTFLISTLLGPTLLGLLLITASVAAYAQRGPLALPTTAAPTPTFDAHIRAAGAALKAHLPREAASEYQAALRLHPRDPDAHFALGGVDELLARPRDAEREYREAIRLNPAHAAAHSALAGLLDDRGLAAAALAQNAQALALEPQNARLHCNQGDLWAEAKHWAAARREYQAALRLSPGLREARRGLAALPPAAPKRLPSDAHKRGAGTDAGFTPRL